MLIYKICDATTWRAAEREGSFSGLPLDLRDGYIHMSPASEVEGTLAKHFVGQTDLLLIAVERDVIADIVRDEASRGGVLFPHIYGDLPMRAVVWCEPIAQDAKGRHVLPARFRS